MDGGFPSCLLGLFLSFSLRLQFRSSDAMHVREKPGAVGNGDGGRFLGLFFLVGLSLFLLALGDVGSTPTCCHWVPIALSR